MADSPFKYVQNINSGIKNVEITKEYNKFLINRAFSYHLDTVLIANELNQYPNIDNDVHYAAMVNLITPRQRFSKWAKVQKDVRAETISKFFKISYREAQLQAEIYNDEQVEYMTSLLRDVESSK